MGWLASLLVALLSAGVGLFAAGFVMNACVGWYRVSSFEGKAGYAVVAVALLGGIAAFVVGLVTARLAPTGGFAGFARSVGIAWALVLGAALLAMGLARALADIPPTLDGVPLRLEVEVRLPVDVKVAPAATDGASYVHLHSVVRRTARKSVQGDLRLADARHEDGRVVVPASAPLFTQRGARSLGFKVEGLEPFGFLVPLPRRPSRAHEAWSEWGPRPRPPNVWPASKPSYRFRVQKVMGAAGDA